MVTLRVRETEFGVRKDRTSDARIRMDRPDDRKESIVNDWFVARDGLIGAARFPSLARAPERISVIELLLLLLVRRDRRRGGWASEAAARHSRTLDRARRVADGARHGAGAAAHGGMRHECGSPWNRLAADVGGHCAVTARGRSSALSLLGPMMDIALRGAQGGRRVYAALVIVAGVATNLLALASRALPKVLGLDLAGARPFDIWWLQASITYTLSGIVAGLLGAACWFHFNDRKTPGRKRDLRRHRRHRHHRQPRHQPAGASDRPAAWVTSREDSIICRHQLFFDPRVPYTSQNGSASIQLPHGDEMPREELLDAIRDVMRAWFVDGSDPGLALATRTCDEMTAFARGPRRTWSLSPTRAAWRNEPGVISKVWAARIRASSAHWRRLRSCARW